ncbi:hydroxyisourate hydrolase [Falsiroseomonas selenitidurans]|uniref:5-hydroxyisourate hydrolase n=1 Tax=Falsiroseomonas selenitidurans TaxID=2716335 RepID=A0ABX1EAV4_9PROT|nr:hydroxyisourate hydrolase [Falsiroseomonas selenitidurans]NKC32903.1 hydroxyisourate hydrolase [Falsiroseomonas selenitidurans]
MKPSALTTHVLDTGSGRPAPGVTVELFRHDPSGPVKLAEAVTNADGRTDAPLLGPDSFAPGTYELRFHIGAHFGGEGFLGIVPIVVRLAAGQGHYHVPLLCSPWSYATYRGS